MKNNTLSDLYLDTTYYTPVKITSVAFGLVLILLGMTGNTIILLGSIKYNAFRLDKVTVTLIQHLAVSDLASTIVLMIPSTIATMVDYWPFGYTFCKVHFYLILICGHSSVCHICALTTCKFVSLQKPFRAQLWGRKRGHLLAAAVWAWSVIPATILIIVNPDSIYYDNVRIACMYDFSDPVWKYLLPTVSFLMAMVPNIIVLVSTIGLITSAYQIAKRGRETVKWQGVLAALLVALVYSLTYSPHIVMNFMGNKYLHTDQANTKTKISIIICGRLILINYVSNVFIYTASINSFRKFLFEKVRPCGFTLISPHSQAALLTAETRV